MTEIVVAGISESRGQKSDEKDAFRRAEELRTGSVKTPVLKAPRRFGPLREPARVHAMLVRDVVRVPGRLEPMYRSRGIATPGTGVYRPRGREGWLARLPLACRSATARRHEPYDLLLELKKAAEKDLLGEARRHPIWRLLTTAPGLGPIRVARLLPIVVTPHRFRTRRLFRAYGGLGIVMRSSSDWVRTEGGRWIRAKVRQTRGLNRNHNAPLKGIFRGSRPDSDRR